ncbi:glycosyltransferase [Paenibacillus crassostreae]|uniref:glycosyltransferase n=1 Tax=Paenibacillus crassostreae TaxID=1763538 RepID=UPI001E63EC99|nr:glycosyltransferase [Paenibacillus crassostreae]
MFNISNKLYLVLYKFGILTKPVLKRIFPSSLIQRTKKRLLKSAFPIDNNKKGFSNNEVLYIEGVNLLGYARAEMGIGESCRIAAKSMDAVDLSFGILNFTGTNSARMSDLTWAKKEISEPIYNVNIFHINAEQMIEVYAHYGNTIFQNRYNIGYWHWELPDFPDEWQESFSLVDEIWAPSTFVVDSIAMKSPVPVVKIPHSIEVNINEIRDRAYFNLPERTFLFLSMYDLKSYQQRKNPQASIKSFQLAFQPDDVSVGLVIKVNSATRPSQELDELYSLIGNYKNVYLIEKTLSRNDTNALIFVTDSYISLHRSEGFGLGLAEAMYLGKPVIGTNWSSNTDFMDHSNSCLVDYNLIKLNHNHGPYKAYQHWADPDVEHASRYMRKLCEDRNFYKEISLKGEQDIKRNYSPQVIGEMIEKRLQYINLWKFGG